MTTTTRRGDLRDRYARAIAARMAGDPDAIAQDAAAFADAVGQVRDAELDRLLNQVADYERQIQQLAGEKDQAVRDLTDALAEITRLTQQPTGDTEEH